MPCRGKKLPGKGKVMSRSYISKKGEGRIAQEIV